MARRRGLNVAFVAMSIHLESCMRTVFPPNGKLDLLPVRRAHPSPRNNSAYSYFRPIPHTGTKRPVAALFQKAKSTCHITSKEGTWSAALLPSTAHRLGCTVVDDLDFARWARQTNGNPPLRSGSGTPALFFFLFSFVSPRGCKNMPPKRRRPGEAVQASPPTPPPLLSKPADNTPAVTRAAARQTPIYPPPIPNASPPKIAPAAPAPVATPVPLPIIPGQAPSPPKPGGVQPRSPPATRLRPPPVSSAPGSAAHLDATLPSRGARAMGGDTGKENVRPSGLVSSPDATYHVPFPHQQGRLSTTSLVNHHGYLPTASRMEMPSNASTVTPVLPPKPATLATADKPPLRSDRNIDKVVLGNLCFKTWYPSYYGKELLGDTSGNARNGLKDHATDASKAHHGKKDREQPAVLERLYVCPSCFKYAKELVAWWGHVRSCELKGRVLGDRVYTHPRGRRKIRVAHDGKGPGPKKRRGDGGVRYTEQIVQDEGEWSVWEVDGEVDGVSVELLYSSLSYANRFSYFPKIYRFLPSYSLTTNRYFSM